MERVQQSLGAYGLILPDITVPHRLNSGPNSWAIWRHRVEPAPETHRPTQSWSEQRAVLQLTSGGVAIIDRWHARTTLLLDREPSGEAMVHPHLAVTAAVTAHWRGDLSFHGGVVGIDGHGWVVLGDREDGKSSTVAWCARSGVDVLSDDLAVLDGVDVLAGPRCIDLRDSAAEHFGMGQDIGVVGNRRRWRVALPEVAHHVPLAGWLVLAWGPDVTVRQVPTAEKFARLAHAQAFRMTEARPAQWLRLLGLPMLELARPRDWSRLDEAMVSLLARLRTY